MTLRAMQPRGSDIVTFPGPLRLPSDKSFLSLAEELHAINYSHPNSSDPFPQNVESFVFDTSNDPRCSPSNGGKRRRRRNSKRSLPPRFRTAPPPTPAFTDTWHNRYSSQTYVNDIIMSLSDRSLDIEMSESDAMDVDPFDDTQSPPRTPPGFDFFDKNYYAGAVASMILKRSEVKRKRNWSWAHKPSRLSQEVRLI